MEYTSQLNLVEPPESVWHEPQLNSEAARRVFSPFVGICVGLGIGLVAWGVLLFLWYALSA